MRTPAEDAGPSSPVERLRAAREAFGWSSRALAAQLGEHLTTVLLWDKGRRALPESVPSWLWEASAPVRRRPHLEQAGGPPGDMALRELQARLHLLRWSRVRFRERARLTEHEAACLLDGSKVVSAPLAAWLREISDPLRRRPTPVGWLRAAEVLPPPSPGARGVECALEDSPRRKAIQARRQAEQAARARLVKEREQERVRRRLEAHRLRHEEGLTYDKIGERLGVSHQAALKLVRAEERRRAGEQRAA